MKTTLKRVLSQSEVSLVLRRECLKDVDLGYPFNPEAVTVDWASFFAPENQIDREVVLTVEVER